MRQLKRADVLRLHSAMVSAKNQGRKFDTAAEAAKWFSELLTLNVAPSSIRSMIADAPELEGIVTRQAVGGNGPLFAKVKELEVRVEKLESLLRDLGADPSPSTIVTPKNKK